MSRRVSLTLLFFFLVALTAGALLLERKIPPRAARLLPEADAIVFVNLKPLRLATHWDEKPVPHSPEYQAFIDHTGIVAERDLDSAAFALSRMPDPSGPNGAAAFSEVFTGRFGMERVAHYLKGTAAAEESYAGHVVYLIPVAYHEFPASTAVATGRTLRVVLLDDRTVAISNAPTPEQIHAMVDRYRTRSYLNPFSGPTLLSGLYSEVPVFSAAWGVGAIGLPFSEGGRVSVLGLHLPLSEMTPFVASLRYVTDLHVRVEQIADNDAAADRSVEKLTSVLLLVRGMQQMRTPGTNDPSIRQITDSLKIEQHGDRAVLTAEIPLALVRRLTSPAMEAVQPGTSSSGVSASK